MGVSVPVATLRLKNEVNLARSELVGIIDGGNMVEVAAAAAAADAAGAVAVKICCSRLASLSR